ncbi:CU044_2847 family protein [Dactylosporangium sp. CA-139066]|uniref:CU044_2847 family protein n=1 Tax=Dactylosporangium sp. CA-139066 TaxID=3239930 RepID=UPI003D8CFB62
MIGLSQVVTYDVGDVAVSFEIDPVPGFVPAGMSDELVGRVRDAVQPAVLAAREVLEQVRQARPDRVEVKFGVKVTGTANWLVAKAATEGNFEITLAWGRDSGEAAAAAS